MDIVGRRARHLAPRTCMLLSQGLGECIGKLGVASPQV